MYKQLIIPIFLCCSSMPVLAEDDALVSSPCDEAGLTGALHGLCNAYCEAMDCDEAPEASNNACQKVLSNYDKKRGEDDPAMPCIKVDNCPCTAIYLDAINEYNSFPGNNFATDVDSCGSGGIAIYEDDSALSAGWVVHTLSGFGIICGAFVHDTDYDQGIDGLNQEQVSACNDVLVRLCPLN